MGQEGSCRVEGEERAVLEHLPGLATGLVWELPCWGKTQPFEPWQTAVQDNEIRAAPYGSVSLDSLRKRATPWELQAALDME